jgi:K+-sensing histidine kinase KdpD
MSKILDRKESRRELRAQNPDLSLLACEAAIDLDNLLLKKYEDLSMVKNLAQQLQYTVEVASANGTGRALMDAATFSVLTQAVLGAPGISTVSQMEDIFKRAAEMADLMSSADLATDPEKQKTAKKFCLALSKAASDYSRSIYEPSDRHPFER